MSRVSAHEVTDLLRRVGRGEVVPRLVNPDWSWTRAFCGPVPYQVDGWEIVIFNDCYSWDYVESVRAPDGRVGEYEDWGDDQPDERLRWEEPGAVVARMVEAFEQAV